MGEQEDHVFNVGAIGIDSIINLHLLDRTSFEESIGFKLGMKNLLVTFHPVTLEAATAEQQFCNLLTALGKLHDTHLIFTKANADTNGRIINSLIDEFVADRSATSVAFASLGQLRYLSAIQFVDGVVGNSSSGLLEVPSFRKGTVNIGDRQKGRIKADSVIDCQPIVVDISRSIKKLYDRSFLSLLKKVINPYGDGGASGKIADAINVANIDSIIKKSFYDV